MIDLHQTSYPLNFNEVYELFVSQIYHAHRIEKADSKKKGHFNEVDQTQTLNDRVECQGDQIYRDRRVSVGQC